MNLSNGHWTMEQYKETVDLKTWKKWCLEHGDTILMCGRLRRLKARRVCPGVYEISKVPLPEPPKEV